MTREHCTWQPQLPTPNLEGQHKYHHTGCEGTKESLLWFFKRRCTLYSNHIQELNNPRHPSLKNYYVIKLQINRRHFHKSLSHSLAELGWDAEFRRDTTDYESDPADQLLSLAIVADSQEIIKITASSTRKSASYPLLSSSYILWCQGHLFLCKVYVVIIFNKLS